MVAGTAMTSADALLGLESPEEVEKVGRMLREVEEMRDKLAQRHASLLGEQIPKVVKKKANKKYRRRKKRVLPKLTKEPPAKQQKKNNGPPRHQGRGPTVIAYSKKPLAPPPRSYNKPQKLLVHPQEKRRPQSELAALRALVQEQREALESTRVEVGLVKDELSDALKAQKKLKVKLDKVSTQPPTKPPRAMISALLKEELLERFEPAGKQKIEERLQQVVGTAQEAIATAIEAKKAVAQVVATAAEGKSTTTKRQQYEASEADARQALASSLKAQLEAQDERFTSRLAQIEKQNDVPRNETNICNNADDDTYSFLESLAPDSPKYNEESQWKNDHPSSPLHIAPERVIRGVVRPGSSSDKSDRRPSLKSFGSDNHLVNLDHQQPLSTTTKRPFASSHALLSTTTPPHTSTPDLSSRPQQQPPTR